MCIKGIDLRKFKRYGFNGNLFSERMGFMFQSSLSFKKSIIYFLSIIISLFTFLNAAPHWGDTYKLKQPDNSLVEVKVWGDEFYQRVESVDGYTLIRDQNGWICYAQLNTNGSDFVASPVRYTGQSYDQVRHLINLTKGLSLKPEFRRQKHQETMNRMYPNNSFPYRGFKNIRRNLKEKVLGLTILIDFKDCEFDIPAGDMKDYLNKEKGYTGYANNGSIREYFLNVSGGKLDYENELFGYYRAKKEKSYYDDTAGVGAKAQELIYETLEWVRDSMSFDFSKLTKEIFVDTAGDTTIYVLATNVFYAGFPESGWAKGLWPHSWAVQQEFIANGVRVWPYQMTNIGLELNIGTFCHENGHMILNFPDLYDYGYDSKGIGRYGLMCMGTQKNPVPPCAPLRIEVGWEDLIDLSAIKPGNQVKLVSNTNKSGIYYNPADSLEFFVVEAREKTGRSVNLPDHGLMVWHVDQNMYEFTFANDYQQMTSDSHYIVALEQADGLVEMEKNLNYGNVGDLYYKGGFTKFNDYTQPNAHWWNNSASGLNITNVSRQRKTVSFFIGDIPLAIQYPEAGDIIFAKDKINILWDYYVTKSFPTADKVKLEFSSDDGQNYKLVGDSLPNTGLFLWEVPNLSEQKCRLKITCLDSIGFGYETERFIIKKDASLITKPAGAINHIIIKGQNDDQKLDVRNPGKGTLKAYVASQNGSRHVLINELYPCSPSKYYDGLELWNNGPDIDMTGWKVSWVDNGGTSGIYNFPDKFIFKSGKTLVLKDFEDADNDTVKYIGANLYWSWTDKSNGNFTLAVSLINSFGQGVDFVKNDASMEEPPEGCKWVGPGIIFDNDFIYRKRNVDFDKKTDWGKSSEGSICKLNPGQNNDDNFAPWLILENHNLSVKAGAMATVNLKFKTEKLDLGMYKDILWFTHNDRNQPNPFALPLNLEIAPSVSILDNNGITGTLSFNLSGNPVSDKVDFIFPKRFSSFAEIRIFDPLGNEVASFDYPNIDSWDLTNKNGRKVENGVYKAVLQVILPNGQSKIAVRDIGVKAE